MSAMADGQPVSSSDLRAQLSTWVSEGTEDLTYDQGLERLEAIRDYLERSSLELADLEALVAFADQLFGHCRSLLMSGTEGIRSRLEGWNIPDPEDDAPRKTGW